MIQIKDLSFGYSKRKTLFSDISFEIEPGHIYGLLGKNGSGKTTFLKLLSGLSFPDSGFILNESEIPGKRSPSFLSQVYFMPEEISLPSLDIPRIVEINSPFYRDFINEKFYHYLEQFEINTSAKLHELSMGQRKKVVLAFAFATNSKYLFLDEPANGLDITSKAVLRSILASNFSEEKTIIISTHMIRDLESMIDRLLIISNGEIILQNDIDQFAGNTSINGESEIENLFKKITSENNLKQYHHE